MVQIADFQYPELNPGGQAGYISPFAYQVISPLVDPLDAPRYSATVTTEPSSAAVVLGIATIAGALGMARGVRARENAR